MASSPQYTAIPKVGIGKISVANTSLTGTGTLVNVVSAGTNGSRVDSVTVKATTTTTNDIVRLFLYDGSIYSLLTEILVSAITISSTIKSFETTITLGIVIPSGYSLYASTHVGQSYNILSFGGDF